MALDPRSIIGEILSRRPDLRRTYAPQAQALGVQIAGLKPAVEARRRLDAQEKLRSGTVPDTTLGPVPVNMGGFPPRATTESANMEFGRERERARMRSPFSPDVAQEPFGGRDDLAPPPQPSGLATRGPMPPSFGANPSIQDALANRAAAIRAAPPFTGNLPQPRQTMALGSGERAASPLPGLPQPRPPEMGPPMPTPFAGNMPQPRPSLPTDPSLARDTSGIPPQIAELMEGTGVAPAVPPSGAPFSPYGQNASLARLPQARPDVGPAPGPPPPLSPDQRIANSARDVAAEAVRQQAAARASQPPPGAPGQPRLLGAGTSLDLAGPGPKPPLGSTVLSDMLDPSAQFASVGERIAPYAGTGAMTARLPRPRPDFSPQLGDVPPAGTAPLEAAGQDLPAPGPGASLTPQQIQRTMGAQAQSPAAAAFASPPASIRSVPLSEAFNAPPPLSRDTIRALGFGDPTIDPSKAPVAPQISPLSSAGPRNPLGAQALYNQPPPGMTLPPGVTLPDVGRLGFGDPNVDPSKAPVQRYGSNTGKYAGAALGAIKGLAGGPVGAVVGGALGWGAGKRVGGLTDREFGLGARFTNPNYAQGIVANPPAIMGVEPISQPVDIPVTTTGQSGIFGRGLRGLGQLGQKTQGILARVASGGMSIKAAADTLGMSESRVRDSLGSTGSAGSGSTGGGWGGWGGGGTYGGGYGRNLTEGVGGAYRNR